MNKLKNAWRSTTIWFNGVMATAMVVLPVAQDAFPQLQEYVPSNVYKLAMGAVIVANILLRFKTTTDLAEKGKKDEI